MFRSDEFRGEAERTLGWLFYCAAAFAGVLAVFLAVGLVMALTVGGSTGFNDGTDVHGPLRQGATIGETTEDRRSVAATIDALTWAGSNPQVVVSISGGGPAATGLTRWSLYLDDNTQLPMTGEALPNGEYRFAYDGAIAAGRSVRFVHFDPDDSHGDIYFDVVQP